MNKVSYILLALIICLGLTMACEDNGSESVSGVEPFILATFINATDLSDLNDSLKTINTSIASIDSRLAEIEELIDGGDMTDFKEEQDSLKKVNSELDIDVKEIESDISLIGRGEVEVKSISSTAGKEPIIFADSMNLYRFPINSSANFSDYQIAFVDKNYQLGLEYQFDTIVRERKIIFEAINIKLADHDFLDSTFINDENELIIYF